MSVAAHHLLGPFAHIEEARIIYLIVSTAVIGAATTLTLIWQASPPGEGSHGRTILMRPTCEKCTGEGPDMTDDSTEPSPTQPSDAPTNGKVSTGSGVKLFAFQGVLNRFVRTLLRVPLLSQVVGNKLITLYVVGRKSGKLYTVPMAYLWHEGALLLGSGFAWGKNLRTGDTLEVRFMGKRRSTDVRVLTDEVAVVEHYAVIARRNPGFAKINKIGFGEDGNPDPHDLHSAWAAGARVFLLTLR